MKQRAPRTARLGRRVLVAMLCCLVLPAAASATSVTVRIEGRTGTLIPRTAVTLPANPVAPAGDQSGSTCAANSVVAAVDVATRGAWNGIWSPTSGWSLDTIEGASAKVSDGRKWLVILNGDLVNDPPCQRALQDNDTVTLFPACLGITTSNCFKSGILDLAMPAIIGPGAPINIQVWETTVTLGPDGSGSSQRGPSLGASVVGPDGYTTTDSHYGTGQANLTIAEKGPAVITTSKANFAQDRADICVTEGADGYCGTTLAPPVPFDPLAFCQTTGTDGYCGSPDKVPPVGRVGTPTQGQVLSSGPAKLTGTVDFDPSLTDHVNLRLVRQLRITVKKVTHRKVWVTRRIHGKKVRKRVTRRKVRKVRQTACYYWSDRSSLYKRMKKCDASTAPLFRAAGAEIWSYEFTSKLPAGAYTLDVQAVDGAGNVDAAPELGRNRVTFTVK